MAFQEKSAYIMTIALALTGAIFFPTLISHWFAKSTLSELRFLIVMVVIQVIIAVVGHIVIAALSPKDANAALDEREKLILVKAGHYSGLLLGLGVLFSLATYLFIPSGDLLFILVSGSFFLSQISEYIIQIFFFRRGC